LKGYHRACGTLTADATEPEAKGVGVGRELLPLGASIDGAAHQIGEVDHHARP
jgi:hypothetical protein